MISSTKKVRDEGLDKFYTKPEVALHFINKVNNFYSFDNLNFIVEPSAGNGSFSSQINFANIIALDILPENETIIQQDFFTFTLEKYNLKKIPQKKILVIGNPPFGKKSSLAIKFFNYAASFCDIIAFIIPKTFRKVSVQNQLHKQFHCIYDEDIPIKPCCFEPPMMVKCCFQIWEKNENKIRPNIILETKHDDWEFLSYGPKDERNQPTPPKNADFALRAYGGKIGEIKTENLHLLRPKSWHWIKSNIEMNELITRFEKLDYSNSLNTARQNSMGRGELVLLYKEEIEK